MSDNKKPWADTPDEIIEKYDVTVNQGLSSSEVQQRRDKYGNNTLKETERKSTLSILVDQFKSVIMALLALAAVVSFLFDEWLQSLAIIIVLFLTAAIGFFTELRAVRSMESLKQLSKVTAKVRRDGEAQEISAEELVPGDIVLLDSGDIVTADIRLLEANKIQADESTLTGESTPVQKNTEKMKGSVSLADRTNMVFKGTTLTRGSGLGVVTSIGTETELGTISTLVSEAKEEVTPLEKRLNALGRKLVWFTVGIAGLVGVTGILRGKELLLMIETGIALAVAAIPEGLPIVATVALARGMLRMAKKNALINRLSSVETLGATNVIFSDKTGTLTLNKMTVQSIVLEADQIKVASDDEQWRFTKDNTEVDPKKQDSLMNVVKIGVLCNNATVSSQDDDRSIGDPMEIALLETGAQLGMNRSELLEELPEHREEAFDPDTKMMATYHKQNDKYFVAIKGAPEAVLRECTRIQVDDDNTKECTEQTKEAWSKKNEAMAENGLRILAVAYKIADSTDEPPYSSLTLVGLVGLLDPPRKEVKGVLSTCREAGINVVMVTGDHPATAGNIAKDIELVKEDPSIITGSEIKPFDDLSEEEKKRFLKTNVFARMSPEQKLDLISIHQHNGSIVAMTGDGVNDAPALKKADIGIAMGKRGTQVAKDASDVILQDDAFSTIMVAVEYGRVIFSNIRKFVLFMLSGNMGEIMAVGFASALNYPLPILPLQILYVNLILDVFPALALGVSEGKTNVLQQPPRDPHESILMRSHWFQVIGYGVLIASSIIGALLLSYFYLGFSVEQSVTISFLTLTLARLGHVFNMRDTDSPLIRNEITRNPYIWGAIGFGLVLIAAAVFLPGLSDVLSVERPNFGGWVVVITMSLIPLVVGQSAKLMAKYLKRRNKSP